MILVIARLRQPHTDTFPASGGNDFNASVFKSAAIQLPEHSLQGGG
jgi:hypothetical protein